MNADKILFRCSSLGHLMVEPKEKSPQQKLAEAKEKLVKLKEDFQNKKEGTKIYQTTADKIKETEALIAELTEEAKQPHIAEGLKTHLVEVFVTTKYGRKSDIASKYTNKGLLVEEDSLTLFTKHENRLFIKNEKHFTNDFISGTPDIILDKEDEVIDIKSSFDIFTFNRNKVKGLNKLYYWQLQGYMALTGKSNARLAYCLTNTPDSIVNDEKRRLAWKWNVLDPDGDPDLQTAFAEIERLHNYDEIDIKERVQIIEVPRNDEDINRLYERVKLCRQWMNDNLFNQK